LGLTYLHKADKGVKYDDVINYYSSALGIDKKNVFPITYDTDPRCCEISKYSLAALKGLTEAANMKIYNHYTKECSKKYPIEDEATICKTKIILESFNKFFDSPNGETSYFFTTILVLFTMILGVLGWLVSRRKKKVPHNTTDVINTTNGEQNNIGGVQINTDGNLRHNTNNTDEGENVINLFNKN